MEASQYKTLMTEGAVWKKIVFFALPLFLGNLFQQLYNTADSLIVGNFLGENALAAVSSSGNLIFLMVGFFSGIAIGAGVVIACYFGAKNYALVEKAVHTTVAFGLAASAVLTALGVWLTPQILVWMATPENVLSESILYLRTYFMGSAGLIMYNISAGILQAVGDSRHPLYYLIISSFVNIILDIVFITVFGMGVEGAALATILSQFISAIICLTHLMRSKDVYRLSPKKIRFDLPMLKIIVQNGLPAGFQNSIIGIANVVVQSNINSFGSMAMAGCGAYSKIEGFAFLPITSFTMALTTFVGQNLGAKEYARVRRGARFGIICSMTIAELIGLVTFVWAPQLIAAFNDKPEVIAYGTDRAHIAAFFFCLLAYSHCISSVLRGAGKSTVPMLVMLACWCVIRVTILSVFVPMTGSIAVVYWVYPITWSLSSIVFLIYYYTVDWIHNFDRAK